MADPVLLTGATGFVGRALLAELVARGIPVHAASRRSGPALPGVTWHTADLLTPEGRAAVAGLAPRLVHCAWDVKHGTFWTSPANTLWQTASLDLVRRFCLAGGRRVLIPGTCAEYDFLAPGPWNEDRTIAPATPYGQAKALLHRNLTVLCGDILIWARLFHLYGPGEDPRRLIPSLIVRMRMGLPAEVRAADLVRDYASSGHVARCLAGLLDTGATGTFDIGSGAPRTLGTLARIVAASLGTPQLLHLSHSPTTGDPAAMTPRIIRLRDQIGPCTEKPEYALQAYTKAVARETWNTRLQRP